MPTSPSSSSGTWWTEGNRKMLVTIVAIIAVAVAAVVWMLAKPDDLPFSELMTWLTPIIGGATSLFTGANLYEHHKKSSSQPSSPITLAVPFGLLLLLLLTATGCASGPKYPQLAQASLGASASVATAAKLEAARAERLTACVTAAALETALSSAEEALFAYVRDTPDTWALPGVEVDLRACSAIDVGDLSLLEPDSASRIRGTVEGLAPAAIVVTRAVLASTSLECPDLVIASAVLAYLEGATSPILAWLEDPGRPLSIPAVPVELSVCR